MRQPPLFPAQRLWRVFACFIIVAALSVVAWQPKISVAGVPGSMCLFHEMTGLPCALCGGTRAAHAILHGDFSQALRLNAAAFPAIASLALAALILSWEALRGRALTNWKALAHRYKVLFPIVLGLLLLWWVPQMIGALDGSKSELINLRNPIAHSLAERFGRKTP